MKKRPKRPNPMLLMSSILMMLTITACFVPRVESFEGSGDKPAETGESSTRKKPKRPADLPPADQTPSPRSDSPPGTDDDGQWVGLLRSTSTVNFGGNGYCNYSIRMEDVRVQLTVDDDGGVLAVNVAATAIEESPQCQQRPIPRNVHSYDYTTSTATRGPITLSASQTNEPHAKATIEVALTDTTPHATIHWQREDTTDPLLAWQINEAIPLTRTLPTPSQ